MRTIRDVRKIKILLGVLCVTICSLIIVAIYFNSRTQGATTCPNGCSVVYNQKLLHDEICHYYECQNCKTQYGHTPHDGADCLNGGKCYVCQYVYEEHSATITYEESTQDGYHTVKMTCTCGNSSTNSEKCTLEETISHMPDVVGKHYIKKKCKFCNDTSNVVEECSGANCSNGGKCTVCNYQYEYHETSKINYDGSAATKGYHGVVVICTCGKSRTSLQECTLEENIYSYAKAKHMVEMRCKFCNKVDTSTVNSCSGGESDHDEGKCALCSQPYLTHSIDTNNPIWVEVNSEKCERRYYCNVAGCEEYTSGGMRDHQATHSGNDGKCTNCNSQIHGRSSKIVNYTCIPSELSHAPVYGCIKDGCSITEVDYDKTEKCSGGESHDNGGKCSVCENVYIEHAKKSNGYCGNKTETTHTYYYDCIADECDYTYTGQTVAHSWGNYQDKGDGTHSKVCTTSSCGYTTTENHNYENGECTLCGAEQPCTHTSYKTKYDETNHWEECENCGLMKENSKVAHTYGAYIKNHDYQNGKCSDCEAEEPEEECEHEYVSEHNENQHWKRCKKCNNTIEKVAHTYGTYTNNGDGTHKATCTNTSCGYVLIENHDYQNGKCSDCEAKEPEQECEHEYVSEHNENQHWKECKKCGHKTEVENHNYKEGICTVCGAKDTPENTEEDPTKAPGKIPQTGVSNVIMIVIVMLGAVLAVAGFKLKQYKDI